MRNTRFRPGENGAPIVALGIVLLGFLCVPSTSAAIKITVDSDSDSAVVDSTTGHDWEKGSKDVVRMGQDIDVPAGETIEGDCVAIGGRITVAGTIKGDAVSVGGGIRLRPTAVVNGDVVTVGGKLDREPGATVHGQNVSVGPAGAFGWVPRFPGSGNLFHHRSAGGLISRDILRCLGFFIVGLIIFFAFPKRMGVVRETIRTRFWLSLVVGFGALIGVSAALILLTITCIGIFVALPGAFIFLLAIAATAAVAASLLGEAITRRPVTTQGSWVLATAIGMLAICAVSIIGRILTSSDGGFIGGFVLLAITKAAWAVLAMVGFGSLILSRLGSQTPPPQAWVPPTTTPGSPAIPPTTP